MTICNTCNGTGEIGSGMCHCGDYITHDPWWAGHSGVEMAMPCPDCTNGRELMHLPTVRYGNEPSWGWYRKVWRQGGTTHMYVFNKTGPLKIVAQISPKVRRSHKSAPVGEYEIFYLIPERYRFPHLEP